MLAKVELCLTRVYIYRNFTELFICICRRKPNLYSMLKLVVWGYFRGWASQYSRYFNKSKLRLSNISNIFHPLKILIKYFVNISNAVELGINLVMSFN